MHSPNHFSLKVLQALAAEALIAVVAGGCGSPQKVYTGSSPSVGQQLQDLEKSYRDGIITEKEYNKLKKALIKQND